MNRFRQSFIKEIHYRTLSPVKADVVNLTIDNRGKIPETVRNPDATLKKVFQEAQPELKETEITTICAVNRAAPIALCRYNTKIDHPVVGKAHRDHKASEPLGVGDVTFLKVESAAFLVGKQGLDLKPFCVESTRLFGGIEVGDKIDGKTEQSSLHQQSARTGPYFSEVKVQPGASKHSPGAV